MLKIKDFPVIYRLGLKMKHIFWKKTTKKHLNRYLKSDGEKKLHLGAGQNKLAGWFNTDYFPRKEIFFLDVTKPFLVPINSFDYVFSEHHIEHIHYKNAKCMALQVFKMLKPGGIFKVCTPDLETYLKTYIDENSMHAPFVNDITENWIKTGFYNAKNYMPMNGEANIAFFINDIFLNYDHKFIYDFKTLQKLLLLVGFSTVKQMNSSKSVDKALNNIEAHSPSPFTLTVEATK